MERQSFGFEYQKKFCDENIIEDKGYTNKFDAHTSKGLPIQIKTFKGKGELMMADPFRYINNNEDFAMVVANRDRNNKIISEKCYYIDNNTLKKILEDNNFSERADYCKRCLDSVTNDRKDDNRFKEMMKQEKENRKESLLNMQAKRDHKKQKRVQWSIPNKQIDTFFSFFKEIDKNELKGL